jgi:hypothetical protein
VLVAPFRAQAQLEAEITMLRHQLNVLQRQASSRPRLTTADRLLFVWLCRLFPSLRNAITIVQPDTVLRWHRSGFRLLLAMEVAVARRPTQGSHRGSQPHPTDECREPALGRAPCSW